MSNLSDVESNFENLHKRAAHPEDYAKCQGCGRTHLKTELLTIITLGDDTETEVCVYCYQKHMKIIEEERMDDDDYVSSADDNAY